MKGTVIRRSDTSWAIVLELGRAPLTGKRKQKWIPFNRKAYKNTTEAKDAANAKLRELLTAHDKGTYVDATKITLTQYLTDWLEKIAPMRRPSTVRTYRSLIDTHIATRPIGRLPLQKLRTLDIESLYASLALGPATVGVLHAVLSRSLQTAVRDGLIAANPARAQMEKPKLNPDKGQGARANCWTAAEAHRVLTTAKAAGPQISAFLQLALDSGARKSELLGLTWDRIDLPGARITVDRQLEPTKTVPWGPTKTGRSREITISAETVARLSVHRKHQRERMMKNRLAWENHDLVFCDDAIRLGQSCRRLALRDFQRIVKLANVRRVTFHACRHSCCSLLLSANVPVHVVSQRLGHVNAMQTLTVYAHALPSSQVDAAATLGSLLAGGR